MLVFYFISIDIDMAIIPIIILEAIKDDYTLG